MLLLLLLLLTKPPPKKLVGRIIVGEKRGKGTRFLQSACGVAVVASEVLVVSVASAVDVVCAVGNRAAF